MVKKPRQVADWSWKRFLYSMPSRDGIKPYAMPGKVNKDLESRLKKQERAGDHPDTINNNPEYNVYKYSISHPNARHIRGFRILHISDMHINGSKKHDKKMFDYLEYFTKESLLRPFDIALISGDIIENKPEDLTDNLRLCLESLKANNKLYVCGNHDIFYEQEANIEFAKKMTECGFQKLGYKQIKYHDHEINLLGQDYDLHIHPSKRKPNEYIKKIRIKGEFNILVAHTLDSITGAYPNVIDLILSGHYHSGEANMRFLSGLGFLKKQDGIIGLNSKHYVGFKWLTDRTLSYINPGYCSKMQEYFGMKRINAMAPGATIITLISG